MNEWCKNCGEGDEVCASCQEREDHRETKAALAEACRMLEIAKSAMWGDFRTKIDEFLKIHG